MSSYIEAVIWTIIKTSFSKKAFCYLLISIVSLIIRVHVDTIIAFFLTTPYFAVNSLIHVMVSTFLIIKSKYFYDIIHRYEPEFYQLVKYLINNYTDKNFKKWKRIVTIVSCIYVYTLTLFVEISNSSIRMIIIEYIICYFLIESYEKYTDGKFKMQTKEYDCKKNDDEIIEKMKETDTYDSELFDIKKS